MLISQAEFCYKSLTGQTWVRVFMQLFGGCLARTDVNIREGYVGARDIGCPCFACF